MFKSILAVFSLMTFMFLQINTSPVFFDAESTVTVYTNSKSSNCSFVFVSSDNYANEFKTIKRVTGECVEGASREYIEKTLVRLNAKKQFEEKVENIKTTYYYSDKIKGYMVVNGKKVNLQTAISDNNNTIATPMIFGSY